MSNNAVRDADPAVAGSRPWLVPVASLLTVGALLGLSTNLVKYAANRGLNPLTLLTWSVVGAALVVSTVNAVTGRLRRPDRRYLEYFFVAALVGVVAPNLLMYAAVPRVGAGFVTLSIAFPPLLTYLGALALRMERFDGFRATGVGVALAGATYMAYMKVSTPDAPVIWIAATMLAPVILAVGNIYRTARWPAGAAPEELVPGVLLVSGAALIAAGAFTGIPLAVRWHDSFDILLIVLQAGLLSAQYVLYFVLQKRGGPVLMSLLGSVAAVIGVPTAVLLLGETLPEGIVPGAVAITVGIALVVRDIEKRTSDRNGNTPARFSGELRISELEGAYRVEGGKPCHHAKRKSSAGSKSSSKVEATTGWKNPKRSTTRT
ncbi:DMT family transporter [bacterium]|nr:DMT family transporter [bacterium]